MRARVFLLLFVVISLFVNQPATCGTLTVGLGGGYDYSNIQSAVNAAIAGDTVLVYPGTYTGSANRNIDFGGKAITLRSTAGPESTIIDCQMQSKGFYFHQGENSNSIVNGLTITNGYSNNDAIGAGIYCYNSSPSITNCVISKCNRNAIFFNRSNTNVTNCIIKNNTWGIQGELGSPTFQGCVIKENTGVIGGMYFFDNSNPIITNCVIANNSTTTNACPGIQIGVNTSFTISHCTITGNLSSSGNASGGGIVYNSYNSSGTVIDSIVWDNWGAEIAPWGSGSPGTIGVTYCDIEGGFNGQGNINNNPLFANLTDFQISSVSPCIDAGTDAGIYRDILGNLRPYDFPGVDNNGSLPEFDMGAYEITPEPATLLLLGLGAVMLRIKR